MQNKHVNRNSSIFLILAAISIISISLYSFYLSFDLSLYGDFWVTVWRYERMVGRFSIGAWNYFTYFFTLYGPQDIITGSLFKIYGYNSSPYYIISYLLRLLASFSLFPLTFYLTKDKLASFFAALFFSSTAIGLQTTDWVFNMPSYLVICFFNLFLYFFLKSRDIYQMKLVLYFALLLFISILISPIRSISIVPFIIIIEFIWLVEHHGLVDVKRFVVRLMTVLVIFLFLLTGTTLFSTPSDWNTQAIPSKTHPVTVDVFESFKTGYSLIQAGQPNFLLNPVTTMGGMLLPNISAGNKRFLTFIGGSLIAIWFLLVIFFKRSKIKDALTISLVLASASLLVPWMRKEYLTSIFSSDHRYLILPAIGLSILFASIISLGKTKRVRRMLFALFSLVLIINIYSTRAYFKNLEESRGQQLYNKIWLQLPDFKEVGHTKGPLVFYFKGERGDVIGNVLNFGFPSKLQLIYGSPDFKSVVTVISFDELISAVRDGKSLEKFDVWSQPISVNNIYSFTLEGKDLLVNTTDATREKLSKLH